MSSTKLVGDMQSSSVRHLLLFPITCPFIMALYSQVHNYLDKDAAFIFSPLYTTAADLE